MYKTVGGASVLILPFISDTERGLDRADFSLMRVRHGVRLNASEDIKSVMVAGVEWDVDGSIGSSGGLVD